MFEMWDEADLCAKSLSTDEMIKHHPNAQINGTTERSVIRSDP